MRVELDLAIFLALRAAALRLAAMPKRVSSGVPSRWALSEARCCFTGRPSMVRKAIHTLGRTTVDVVEWLGNEAVTQRPCHGT